MNGPQCTTTTMDVRIGAVAHERGTLPVPVRTEAMHAPVLPSLRRHARTARDAAGETSLVSAVVMQDTKRKFGTPTRLGGTQRASTDGGTARSCG